MGVSHLGFFLLMIVFFFISPFFSCLFVLPRLILFRRGSLRAVIYCMVVVLGKPVSCLGYGGMVLLFCFFLPRRK